MNFSVESNHDGGEGRTSILAMESLPQLIVIVIVGIGGVVFLDARCIRSPSNARGMWKARGHSFDHVGSRAGARPENVAGRNAFRLRKSEISMHRYRAFKCAA